MAIRGTNIFALLQDSDDEEKPRSSPAPVVSVKQSKPAATVPAPAKKQETRVVEEAPSDPPQKESKHVEKKPKAVLDDRHSKTGRGKEMKKDGQGSHNWGSDVQTRGKGTNAGGGRDKPEKVDPTADMDAEVPPEPVEEEEETEKPAEAPVEAPAESKKEASKPEEPEYIRRRREQEEADERARKEAESYRTYKEFIGAAETSGEEKPKTQTLLAFKGMEGESRRGGRGRGRGRGRPETESRPKAYVPDLGDFPKLG